MPTHEAYEIGEIVFSRELLVRDGGITDVAAGVCSSRRARASSGLRRAAWPRN